MNSEGNKWFATIVIAITAAWFGELVYGIGGVDSGVYQGGSLFGVLTYLIWRSP